MGTTTAPAGNISAAQLGQLMAQTEAGINLKITLRDAKFEAARAEFDLATIDIDNLKGQLNRLAEIKRQADSLIVQPVLEKRR
jgi:hypothetical protein